MTRAEVVSKDFWMVNSQVIVKCVHCGTTAAFYGQPEEINTAQREFFAIHDDVNHQRKRAMGGGEKGQE